MLEKGENKEYLPIEGLPAFRKATLSLLLGHLLLLDGFLVLGGEGEVRLQINKLINFNQSIHSSDL